MVRHRGFVVVLLVTTYPLGFAARRHHDISQEAAMIGLDCPADAARNTKGDCIDAESAHIDDQCCSNFDSCDTEITDALVAYNNRLSIYFKDCDANRNDMKQIAGSSFEVVSGTKLCVDTCQAVGDLSQPLDIQVTDECANFRALREQFASMLMLQGAVVALDKTYFACGSPSTDDTEEPLCQSGQVQFAGPFSFQTPDNSYSACQSRCSETDGCAAFDYTTDSRWDACRGVPANQNPRLGQGGGHHRKYCKMELEAILCQPGQAQFAGPFMFETSANSFSDCHERCSETEGCVAFDYTANGRWDACRGVPADQKPRLGDGGDDSRKYCTMQMERPTTSISTTTTVASTIGTTEECCCGPNPNNHLPKKIKGRYLYPNQAGLYPDKNGYYPNPSGRYPQCKGFFSFFHLQWYPNKEGSIPDCFGMFKDGELQLHEWPAEAGFDACGNVNKPDAWGRQRWS